MKAKIIVLALVAIMLSFSLVGVVNAKSDGLTGSGGGTSPPTPATVQGILIVPEGETVIRGTLIVRGTVIVEEDGTLAVRRALIVEGVVIVDGILEIGAKGKPGAPPGQANRPEETPSGTVPATPAVPHPGDGPATPATPAQPGHPDKNDGYIMYSFTFGGWSWSESIPLGKVNAVIRRTDPWS